MTEKPVSESYITYLEDAIKHIRNGEMFWCALSMKFMGGSYMAIHSKDAPKRPCGVS